MSLFDLYQICKLVFTEQCQSLNFSVTPLFCDALHDLVPFVQFKKRKKRPRKRVTFGKIAGFSLERY